jgi:D-lactate dehydrogenase (cytochrome)
MKAASITHFPEATASELAKALGRIVGKEHIHLDETRRRLHSEDIWQQVGAVVALVAAPASTEETAQVVRIVHESGFAIAPRGAGMSYTGGYVPASERTVSLDMSRMNRILRVSRDDMVVTVEAGVTWKALGEALAPLGLRTPFWGPMSGLKSTIGGGVSQLNAMFGAGQHGTSSESLVALSVVLGDGRVLRTGARGADGDTPFYRHFGPDLAGLFCGDCGVFGVKTEITLRLIATPAHEDHASFSYPTGSSLLRAMAAIARAGIACETCAFDPGLTSVRLARASLSADVKTLGAVIAKEKSIFRGLVSVAKIAAGGRKFVEADEYPLHVVCEGRSAAAVRADMAALRRIAVTEGGKEIANTIAKVIRAMPFPELNSMVGPTGEAWVPVHGVVSLSGAPAILAEIHALYAGMAAVHAAAGVKTGFLFTTMSSNAIIVEPVFFWPEGWRDIHASAIEPAHLARLTQLPPNPQARDVVMQTRKEVLAIFARHGSGHFQLGRTYPYRESRDAASVDLLDTIKHFADPAALLNPGVLGFPVQSRTL